MNRVDPKSPHAAARGCECTAARPTISTWARPLEEGDLKARPGYRDACWPFDIAELNRYYPDANDTGNFGPFNYDDIDF